MARLGRRAKRTKSVGPDPADTQTTADAKPAGPGGLPLPSPIAGTNLVIADIVLRAAGGLLRNRMEKGLLVKSYDKAKAEKLVDGRSVVTSLALWGASRLATRSPVGLAVVAGGLAAKVLYDRGKRLEGKRRARKRAKPAADSES
jgi:hypothetical protein